MKRIVFLLVLILTLFSSVYASNVEIEAQIYKGYTIFTYNIDLGDDDINSFSLEKLEDSVIQIAQGDGEKLAYTTAGDYFIFRTENKRASTFELKLKSESASKQILEKKSFSHYVSFNFPIDNLSFKVILMENIGEIKEAFPRTFEIADEGGIYWEQKLVLEDTLFLINFDNVITTSKNGESDSFSFIILLLLLPIILFIILFFIVKRSPQEDIKEDKVQKKKTSKKKKTTKTQKQESEKKEKDSKEIEEKTQKKLEEKQESKFEEIIDKYLTENEKEVVKLVKENEGISQYDILNYLPSLTKSNLSKIISKLHSKKILNRIRVGKVNKIYLGERTEQSKEE